MIVAPWPGQAKLRLGGLCCPVLCALAESYILLLFISNLVNYIKFS